MDLGDAVERLRSLALEGAGNEIGKVAVTEAGKAVARSASAIANGRARQNVADWVRRLATAIEGRQSSASSDPLVALEDPDASASFMSAAAAAARSSSPERHQMLAELVAARLACQTESDRALAANAAIEILPRLSATHLRALAVLAAVHILRPAATARRAHALAVLNQRRAVGAHTDVERAQFDAAEAELDSDSTEYVEWLVSTLSAHATDRALTEQDLAHLASASCVIVERSVSRPLTSLLSRPNPFFDNADDHRDARSLARLFHGDRLSWLTAEWDDLLEHCTLTPVGLLLGCAAHDAVGGQGALELWEWGDASIADRGRRVKGGWDGREVDPAFFDQLYKQVDQRLARDVGNARRLRGDPRL